MKVEARILDRDSTLTGDEVGMTIDESALAHIMSVLTDLYSDPELAIIREYSTNALDSHVSAGETRPIEVDLPTSLSPFLRIRDYGIGLTAEDIHEVYSKYGTSTKRDSDDVVGMLGLGCKSALTYTDQFTLTGTKDGRGCQVSIGRTEDGGGSMTIVYDGPSNEPSGVEVVIPAKRGNDLETKARHFFSFWQEGTVLVNGTAPTRIDGTWITDKLLMVPASRDQARNLVLARDTNYVVMGNVPYPIPDEFFTARDDDRYGGKADWFGTRVSYGGASTHLVAFVPIGAVNFTPSREALQMTKRTKETVTAVVKEARDTLQGSLFRQIADAKTAQEAQSITRTAKAMGIKEDPIWKGRPVALNLTRLPKNTSPYARHDDDDTLYLIAPTSAGYSRRKTGERHQSVNLDKEYLWLDNFDGAAMTPTKRAKTELWIKQHHPPKADSSHKVFPHIVAVDKLTPDERFWLKGHTIVDFQTEIHPIKLPRDTTPGTNRLQGSYVVWTTGGAWNNETPADKIDQNLPIIFYRGNRYECGQSMEWRYGFNDVGGDVSIVCLPANRVEKFKRDFPQAVEFKEYAVSHVKTYLNNLDKEDIRAAHFQSHGATALAKLDPDVILDPALSAQVRLYQRPVQKVVSQFKLWSRWIDSPAEPKSALDPYPLVTTYQSYTNKQVIDHIHTYVNAVYTAKEAS